MPLLRQTLSCVCNMCVCGDCLVVERLVCSNESQNYVVCSLVLLVGLTDLW